MSGSSRWTTWSVTALNLPEHAGNPIHTDAGARAAGFPRALVAGVTTYSYLTRPVIEGWGLDWVERGRAEVRFAAPVFDGDVVACVPEVAGDGASVRVDAMVGDGGDPRATLAAALDVERAVTTSTPVRDGDVLESDWVVLTGEYGAGYGARASGERSDPCERAGVVHPAVWPALANRLAHRQVARGSWVHVRSRIVHQGLVADGATAELRGSVVQRTMRRSGEWAVIDVQIVVDDCVVVSIDHEAIVALP